jgi:hypothetical protein
MFKTGFTTSASLIALLATITTAISQDPPRSGIYQIQSGSYREAGGFGGSLTYQLPSLNQAFVSLMIVSGGGAAELEFLDRNQQGVFRQLTNGTVSGNIIRFQYVTVHPYGPTLPPAWVDYTVTNAAGCLWISGSITSAPVCCDIPYLFEHQDVRATSAPVLSIRVSQVEMCWCSVSNQNYQVQYQSDLTQHVWTNLGGPVQVNGTTNCVVDSVALGQPQRFYRIITLP